MVVTFLIEAVNRQEKSHVTGLTNSVARTENGLTSNLKVRYRTLAFHLLDGPTQLITMTARGEPDERRCCESNDKIFEPPTNDLVAFES